MKEKEKLVLCNQAGTCEREVCGHRKPHHHIPACEEQCFQHPSYCLPIVPVDKVVCNYAEDCSVSDCPHKEPHAPSGICLVACFNKRGGTDRDTGICTPVADPNDPRNMTLAQLQDYKLAQYSKVLSSIDFDKIIRIIAHLGHNSYEYKSEDDALSIYHSGHSNHIEIKWMGKVVLNTTHKIGIPGAWIAKLEEINLEVEEKIKTEQAEKDEAERLKILEQLGLE